MSEPMEINIILCGVGGQGTILASRLIAAAAMDKGLHVRSAETIGMAQRGGSVFSHLRIGENVSTPRIGKGCADLIIAFEPAEAVRMLPWLKENGCVISSDLPIVPVSAMVGDSEYRTDEILAYLRTWSPELILVDSEKAARELGSAKCLNVVLLGAAIRSGKLGLTQEEILSALHKALPEKLHALNDKALTFSTTS